MNFWSSEFVTGSQVPNIKGRKILSQCYGHVQRMEEGRLPKKGLKWRPPGRRR